MANGRYLEKSLEYIIFSTVWLILTKFDTLTQIGLPDLIRCKNFECLKIQNGKGAAILSYHDI